MKKELLFAVTLAIFAACSPPPAPSAATSMATATATSAPAPINVPAGDYTLDKPHGSLILRISHMGYSHFTARFAKWDAQLHFDPVNPNAASVNASIDPRSLESDNPPAGFLDLLRNGADWLDAAHFPNMAFHSTSVTQTGANTARVVGDFTLRGVTKAVTLDVSFNGGYPGMQLDPHARIGFSAHGALKRSDFGLSYGLPPPGSNMGVSDEVQIIIESESTGPAWHDPAAAQPTNH